MMHVKKGGEKMAEKKTDRSLVLYTALIFVVAILMILISHFSHENLKKQQAENAGAENSGTTITDKVNQLSEENMVLFETISSLNKKIDELTKDKDTLYDEKQLIEEKYQMDYMMIKVSNHINKREYSKAVELFELIDSSKLDEEQTFFYEVLVNKVNKLR